MKRNSTDSNTTDTVYFHPEQIKYLEKIFCTRVLGPNNTEEDMRHYFGQQSVIEFVKSKCRSF